MIAAHGAWDAPVSVLRAQLKEKLEFIHSSVTSVRVGALPGRCWRVICAFVLALQFDKAGKGVDPMKRSQCLQLHKDRELLVSQVTVVSAWCVLVAVRLHSCCYRCLWCAVPSLPA